MNSLLKQAKNLQDSQVGKRVKNKLKDFKDINKQGNDVWFCELCFCLLTSNSKAKTAIAVQTELGYPGFSSHSFEQLRDCLLRNKHRFHNTKSQRIIKARQFTSIKDILKPILDKNGVYAAREWLVDNILGLGYKEASHYLRNIGYYELAILDRHILNLMVEHNIIKEKPVSLSKKNYLAYEKTFQQMAKKLNMSCAELDFYMWYIKAGDVLK